METNLRRLRDWIVLRLMLLLGQLSTRSKVGNLQLLLLLTLLLMLPPLDLMFTGGYGVASHIVYEREAPRSQRRGRMLLASV